MRESAAWEYLIDTKAPSNLQSTQCLALSRIQTLSIHASLNRPVLIQCALATAFTYWQRSDRVGRNNLVDPFRTVRDLGRKG